MMRYILLAALLVASALPAAAQDATQDVGRLTGTLAKIRATGTITLGVRDFGVAVLLRTCRAGSPSVTRSNCAGEIVDDVTAGNSAACRLRSPIRR